MFLYQYQYQYQKTIIFHIQYLTYTATIYSSQKNIYLCTGYLPGPWFEKGNKHVVARIFTGCPLVMSPGTISCTTSPTGG
jgi:hypothetical protein